MDRPETVLSRLDTDLWPHNPPGLPHCHYRRRHDGTDYSCEAAGGTVVTAADCRRCPIPEALAHPHACLYLTPLRHRDEAHFACPWYFSWAREPTARDWRDLCFCQYWFPRGPDEQFLVAYTADRRARYLRVLRGEEPQYTPRIPVTDQSKRSPRESRVRGLWRVVTKRWRALSSRSEEK